MADPDEVHQHWLAAMRCGNFAAAWEQTDRLEKDRSVLQPWHLRWDGSSFHGRHVLIRYEHGLGDTLQYIRYAAELAKTAASVTNLVQPPLVELLSASPNLGRILNGWTAHPWTGSDVEIECTELPYAFRSELKTLPATVPYLFPTAASALSLPEKTHRKRIGLVWASSEWDSSRSIPIKDLAPLAALSGHDFFCLQQGPESAKWTSLPMKITPLHEKTASIPDAAAAMLAMDLIITVDTMTAHLAGALGAPVWLILKHEADWRWMENREDTPWYPQMRLFRQPSPGDWAGVVAHVTNALKRLPPLPAADRLP